jgi:hypothetical protein
MPMSKIPIFLAIMLGGACAFCSCMAPGKRDAVLSTAAGSPGGFITITPEMEAEELLYRRVAQTRHLLQETYVAKVDWETTLPRIVERLNQVLTFASSGTAVRVLVPPGVPWQPFERTRIETFLMPAIRGDNLSVYDILSQAVSHHGLRFSVRDGSVVIVDSSDYDALPQDTFGVWTDGDGNTHAMVLPYDVAAAFEKHPIGITSSAPEYVGREIILPQTVVSSRQVFQELERVGEVKVRVRGELKRHGEPADWAEVPIEMPRIRWTFHELLRELISMWQEMGIPELNSQQRGRHHRTVAILWPDAVEILAVGVDYRDEPTK